MGGVKKIIFLLIPIIGLCQTSKITLEDIESICSDEIFKKVMMERGLINDYDRWVEDVILTYRDNLNNPKLSTSYFIEEDVCYISYDTDNEIYKGEYDRLFDNVKSYCDYIGFDNQIKTEFIKYDCGSGFIIGFGRDEDNSVIFKYPMGIDNFSWLDYF